MESALQFYWNGGVVELEPHEQELLEDVKSLKGPLSPQGTIWIGSYSLNFYETFGDIF